MDEQTDLQYLESRLPDIASDFAVAQRDTAALWEKDWQERFGPQTRGMHELLDRTSVLGEQVETILISHPSAVLDYRTYQTLSLVSALLFKAYQDIVRRNEGL